MRSEREHSAAMRSTAWGGSSGMDTADEVGKDEERFNVHEDAADAHRQVVEMAATIEILTRDFENLQRELLDAYKKLQEYADADPRLHPGRHAASPSKVGTTATGGIVSNAIAKLRTGNYSGGDCACEHEGEIQELRQIIAVKDNALTEALQERNEYMLRLERVEAMVRELHEGTRSTTGRNGLQTQSSSRTASFSAGVPYGMTSTSPVSVVPSLFASAVSSASSTSSGGKELPKHERFDQESTYHSKEDDELFWRRQYRDAVRMRKHQSQSTMIAPPSGSFQTGGNMRPSLKIFSYPNSNRHKGITDENVPFTRYIGISTRQNEIIKEQHRLLS